MNSCDHLWAYRFGEYENRHCTRCGLNQVAVVTRVWSDDGYDAETLIRLAEEPKAAVHTFSVQNPYNGKDGVNNGLGEYVTSASHYKELIKKTGAIEVG